MIFESNCQKRECRWYIGVYQPDGTEMTEVHHCTAFPEGIPNDIAYGNNKHEKVQEGQVGSFIYET